MMTGPSEVAGAAARHETAFSTPSDRELVITPHVRCAALARVDGVHGSKASPELADRTGATMPSLRDRPPRGRRLALRLANAHGREFEATGTYREVDPPKRFVQVMHVNGEENTSTTTFAEENGRTTVTVSNRYREHGVARPGDSSTRSSAREQLHSARHLYRVDALTDARHSSTITRSIT